MRLNYLGKYTFGTVKVSLFFEPRLGVVVTALSEGGVGYVRAVKKLVLSGSELKKPDLSQLHALTSSYTTSLELVTAKPTAAMVERLELPPEDKAKWLERALRKAERDLEGEQRDYETWKGVRDLDEADKHLRNRREEIADLEQKLIASAKEPDFVYAPGSWRPSEWQRTDRIRFHELKERAENRASALRQRIDFTRRTRIKELEQKVRDLTAELDADRKSANERNERVTERLDSDVAVGLVISVFSHPILVSGRKGPAVLAAVEDVAKDATTLRTKIKEKTGLTLREPDETLALLPTLWPDVPLRSAETAIGQRLVDAMERALVLASRESFEKNLTKLVASLLARTARPQLPVTHGFPPLGDGSRRLAYLGLTLAADLRQTKMPVALDIDVLTRHAAVSGGSGSGKSVAARLLVESAALHGVPSVIFDPTRAWTGMANPCTGPLLKRFETFNMRTEWARAFELRIPDVEPFANVDTKELLAYRGLSVIPAWTLTPEQEHAVVVRLLQSVQKELGRWPESQRVRTLLVFEEAHRYLQGGELESLLELLARTARTKGLGLLFVSQNNVDLPPGVRNNAATRIQMQTAYGPDLTRAAQTFGSEYAKRIPSLQQGYGVIHYPEYGAALVAFRPPLCSSHAISEDVARFYQTTRELSRVTQRLLTLKGLADGSPTDNPLTTDTTSRKNNESPANDDQKPQNAKLTRTWRDVGHEFVSRCQSRPSVSELARAIEAAGLKAPTERTLYRFLRSTSGASN